VLFPAMGFCFFAITFLCPKLEQIWTATGLTNSRAQWMMDLVRGFKLNVKLAVPLAVLTFIALEFCWKSWPRYRRTVITLLTIFVHTAALAGITWIAVSIAIAAPLLGRAK